MEAPKEDVFYTIEDIYALPDGERAELIDGKIYLWKNIPLGQRYRSVSLRVFP